MYENMCGLTLRENGFKSFYIRPETAEVFQYVDMQYDSPKGNICVKWEQTEQGKYSLRVKVPFDTTAFVKVPWKDEEFVFEAGEYEL